MSYMKNLIENNKELDFYKHERIQYSWSRIDPIKDIHEGHLAVNIKNYHLRSNPANTEEENEIIYDHVQQYFFNKAQEIALAYGYSGYTIEGRSGGWLEPIHTAGHRDLFELIPETIVDAIRIEKFISFKDKIERLIDFIRLTMQNIEISNYQEYLLYIEEL